MSDVPGTAIDGAKEGRRKRRKYNRSKPNWVPKVCPTCGNEFFSWKSTNKQFCTKECYSKTIAPRYDASRATIICKMCGKTRKVAKCISNRAKFCSLVCKSRYGGQLAAKVIHEKWRTRLVKPKTYRKYFGRHLHRQVMEAKIGRPLRSDEIVHHIDGNCQNNDPSNLQLMTQSEHARIHNTKNRKCDIPGCGRKHLARGFCGKHYDEVRRSKDGFANRSTNAA